MKSEFRPPAVPLVTVDPFFSIWSCANNLHDDCTRHWTEFPNPILAGVIVNGLFYSMSYPDSNFVQFRKKLYQSELSVSPLTTEYTFENDDVKVTLSFTTPLLLNRPDIMARPVSYVAYDIEKKKDDTVAEFIFGINSRCCVRNNRQEVMFKKTGYSLCCGNTVQVPLAQSADCDTIDWGYLHICDKDALVTTTITNTGITPLPINQTYNAFNEMPYMAVHRKNTKGVIVLAYDEIKPIEYFGKPLDEYYTKFFGSFEEMVAAAADEYDEIKKLCDAFDVSLSEEAGKLSDNYRKILALAYRQAIAAHKLVADENGDLLFLSKECESNGCIGTLDVTYPSIPLFLKYNPELVNAMLRPIIKYANSHEWNYEFAPHDVGRYPIANGQIYGMYNSDPEKRLAMQMPIEESGNMLLCLAAVGKFANETPRLFTDNRELMKQWADYLVKYGYDPGNQLCTDDFAGHLEHNCNLSTKAILAVAAYAKLSGDSSYMDIAKAYAAKWEKDALASHGGTRLTFDNPDGWSLKYNLVWDNLLGFNIFSDEIKKNEIVTYTNRMNKYGVPLDSRKDYTKLDWLMWSTCIYDDKEYFDKVCKCIIDMINETPDRVPLTDWYFTSTAHHNSFQNRTVVGGLFINLL